MSDIVLFLDIDDVMNDPDRYRKGFIVQTHIDKDTKDNAEYNDAIKELFTPEAIEVYKWICDTYSPKIVISSSWGRFFDKNHFEKMFSDIGIPLPLHEDWITLKRFSTSNRHNEIRGWLSDHDEVKKYIVLDDTTSGYYIIGTALESKTVFCDLVEQGNFEDLEPKGLRHVHIPKIKSILD